MKRPQRAGGRYRGGTRPGVHTGVRTGVRTGRARGDGEAVGQRHASRARRGALSRRFRAHLLHHLHALIHSLGRMARSPVSSLMTAAVIGIALALPTGLHVLLKNAQAVSAGWENAAQISLFLSREVSGEALRSLIGELNAMDEIASVTHISPRQALEEFQRLSGFGDALQALEANPLPSVIVVQPRGEYGSPAAVEDLLRRLRARPGVEFAQLDMEWVKRLYAMMELGKRAVLVLGGLLGLAVLLIVGNTIRLAIQSRREEIEVQKLIGATDAFIRRPFLYSGCWHGLLGAIFAWILVHLSLLLLTGPVQRLSLLYDSRFEMDGLDPGASLLLMVTGALLGFVGARLAVGRHLREIEPS